MTNKLFALDIGTRSVVGIIIEQHEDHYHVADILVKTHKDRVDEHIMKGSSLAITEEINKKLKK